MSICTVTLALKPIQHDDKAAKQLTDWKFLHVCLNLRRCVLVINFHEQTTLSNFSNMIQYSY